MMKRIESGIPIEIRYGLATIIQVLNSVSILRVTDIALRNFCLT